LPASKDYYRLLQVSPDIDPAGLKKAYRQLAILWHPDRNPGSPVAEERFKAIAEAYAVLSDPLKRRRYDQLGPEAFFGEFGTDEIFDGFDLTDLFKEFGLPSVKESLFAMVDDDGQARTSRSGRYQDFFSEFGQKPTPKGRVGKSPPLGVHLAVSLREAVFGAIKTCAFNSGGEVAKVAVTEPPGARDGQVLTIPKKVQGPGRQPGDLLVTLSVQPDPAFKRRGSDLLTSLPLSRAELSAGCRALVKTLDGASLRLTVPPGTTPGQRLKAAGHGAPGPDGRRGDLLIAVVEAGAGFRR
jgi:DnaJ-class molecular chaperone